MISPNGIGIVFSMESGPVLFSFSHVWADGVRVDCDDAINYIPVGTRVDFVEKVFENCGKVALGSVQFDSPALYLPQALAVWTGKFMFTDSFIGFIIELLLAIVASYFFEPNHTCASP